MAASAICLVAKSVERVDCKTSNRVTAKLGRVVNAERLIQVVVVANVRCRRPESRTRKTRHKIANRFILTPERQPADSGLCDSNKCLPTKFAGPLTKRAVVRTEPVFQREYRLQPVAQFFDTAQPPATAAQSIASLLHVTGTLLIVGVCDAFIDESIQPDGALCLCNYRRDDKNASGTGESGSFHGFLFSVD